MGWALVSRLAGEARAYLVESYLKSVGAATEAHVAKLFGWPPAEVRRACEKLAAQRRIGPGPLAAAGIWVTSALR
jgi:Winged helix DNA-binding domain